ncbi:hypothetical protein DFP95_1592, partial [Cohnella lupini]
DYTKMEYLKKAKKMPATPFLNLTFFKSLRRSCWLEFDLVT